MCQADKSMVVLVGRVRVRYLSSTTAPGEKKKYNKTKNTSTKDTFKRRAKQGITNQKCY